MYFVWKSSFNIYFFCIIGPAFTSFLFDPFTKFVILFDDCKLEKLNLVIKSGFFFFSPLPLPPFFFFKLPYFRILFSFSFSLLFSFRSSFLFFLLQFPFLFLTFSLFVSFPFFHCFCFFAFCLHFCFYIWPAGPLRQDIANIIITIFAIGMDAN